MFSKSTFASLFILPLVALAAPIKRPLAPLKRANEILFARQATPDSYIVALKPDAVDPTKRGQWLERVLATGDISVSAADIAEDPAFKLQWNEDIFNGLAGTFDQDAIEILRARDEVAWISEDIEMYTSAIVTQTNAPWGIARFSTGTESLRGQNPSQLNFEYVFDDAQVGAGGDVYIIDTGVRVSHVDFQGRAEFLGSFGSGVPGQDINGHGTHCAGSAAGSVFGIAKGASIKAVKVMADDGSGSTSDIISGINLSVQTALSNAARPAVISMSLGGPQNRAIDDTVRNAIQLGVPFIVAAGNETQDADNVSPARLQEVITVGATDINDQVAFFSNFGTAVDVFAPGQDILSASPASDDAVQSLSGTSMATPQVAGLALVLMGQEGKLSPSALQNRIAQLSVKNVVGGAAQSGSVDALAATNV